MKGPQKQFFNTFQSSFSTILNQSSSSTERMKYFMHEMDDVSGEIGWIRRDPGIAEIPIFQLNFCNSEVVAEILKQN